MAVKPLAVCGGLLGGIAIVAMKRLRRTDSSHVILLSQCVFGWLIVVAPAMHEGFDFPASTWLALLGLSACATAGQLLTTYAYKLVRVTEGSLIGLLTPVLNVAIGALFFAEAMPLRSWGGALIVFSACGFVLVRGSVRDHMPVAPPDLD